MNRDQVSGGIKDAAGKIQRKFGQAVGNERQEANGAATQVEGKTQKTVGNVADSLDKAVRNVKDSFRK